MKTHPIISALVFGLVTFVVLIALYETAVYLWAGSVSGPIIRVDIIIIYPIIFVLSLVTFFIFRKILK